MAQIKKKDVDEYGIPITEVRKVVENDHTGQLRYIITKHPLLQEFYLYQIDNMNAKKVATEIAPDFKKLEKERQQWRKELDKIIKENNDVI